VRRQAVGVVRSVEPMAILARVATVACSRERRHQHPSRVSGTCRGGSIAWRRHHQVASGGVVFFLCCRFFRSDSRLLRVFPFPILTSRVSTTHLRFSVLEPSYTSKVGSKPANHTCVYLHNNCIHSAIDCPLDYLRSTAFRHLASSPVSYSAFRIVIANPIHLLRSVCPCFCLANPVE
jgi:hypothetical protein